MDEEKECVGQFRMKSQRSLVEKQGVPVVCTLSVLGMKELLRGLTPVGPEKMV